MTEPRFACDAMLCGMSRWLRAWGYDASWTYGIADDDLLQQARVTGRVVLTADAGILRRRCVRAADPPAHAVRNEDPPLIQLQKLARQLQLPRRAMRCMRCGGGLVEVPKAQVRGEAPPRTFLWLDRFWRCTACAGLFWRGTHFQCIHTRLQALDPLAPDSGQTLPRD